MRPLLKYGVPAAAALGAGGYALSQGEDPGSAVLAGAAGGLGAVGGLLGARLAGKYAPSLIRAAQEKVVTPAANLVGNVGKNIPAESKFRNKAVGTTAQILSAGEKASIGPGGQRLAGKLAAGAAVPAGALTAGLGGVALGAIPGSMGVPGFQQSVAIDPESYGSSNSEGARYKAPTGQYM